MATVQKCFLDNILKPNLDRNFFFLIKFQKKTEIVLRDMWTQIKPCMTVTAPLNANQCY